MPNKLIGTYICCPLRKANNIIVELKQNQIKNKNMEHSKNERRNICQPEQLSSFLINGDKVRDTNGVSDACNGFLNNY
jgi:hypothetical protein